jgi:AcrR family transcriptional regulator
VSAQGPKGAQNGKRPVGRERILTAALEILEQDGEAALKFVEIAARADVAISVITHHFGTREGLLSAVHARRFAGLTELDLAVIKQLAATAGGREGVQVGRAALTDGIVDPERAAVRLGRIMAIGATHGRPSLEAAVRSTAT